MYTTPRTSIERTCEHDNWKLNLPSAKASKSTHLGYRVASEMEHGRTGRSNAGENGEDVQWFAIGIGDG